MAMIIRGKSLCPLCNEPMQEGQELKAFPAFLPNDHRFGRFSDAAFHKACFEKDPEGQDADMMLYVWQKIFDQAYKESKELEGTLQEKEAYIAKAFADQEWPPKNGVVVYEQVFTEDGEEAEWWWADKDAWEEFEKAEAEEHRKMEERREEARRLEREAWRYSRDDDY